MKTKEKPDEGVKSKGRRQVSRPLAPEDIRPGDYVAITSVVCEFPLVPCAEDRMAEPRKVALERMSLSLDPLQVMDVCLPAVLVRKPNGKSRTLDVRRHRFARLTERFGRKAFKRLAGPTSFLDLFSSE